MLYCCIVYTCTLFGGSGAELMDGMVAMDVCSRWESWAIGEGAVAVCEDATTAAPARLYPDTAATLETSLPAKKDPSPAMWSLVITE